MKKLLIVSLIIIASLGQIRGEVNKPPAFENASYSYFVFENVPINTRIASVFLNRRSGTPGDIRCYDLNTIGKFSIQRVFISSVLTVYANGSKTSATPPVKLLTDRLVWNASIHGTVQHVVRLTVEDGGGLNDSTLVNITVKDVNEPPVCPRALATVLKIDIQIGQNIYVVECSDPDFDILFKTLYYSSVKIDDYTYFNVSASGEVTLAACIPRIRELYLMIVAQDGGGLKSNVTILFQRDWFKFYWESSSQIPNGSVVQACVGDNVTFPWAYSDVEAGTPHIQWDWYSEDKKKSLVLASYSNDHFIKQQRELDLEFLPNAGLKLLKVKLANAGQYTIGVNLSCVWSHWYKPKINSKRTAFLRVSDFVFDWKSSPLFPNGTVVQACVGDNVTFPWVFNMTSPNPVFIQWTWNSEEEKKRLVLASYRKNIFNKVVPERDLEFLPNAILMLPKVTIADAGLYNIDIEIDGCLQSKRYTQAAFLRVSDFVFNWKSSSLFPNGTVVQACVGDNVSFQWVFNMTSPNPVLIQWNWNSEEEKKRLVLASYRKNIFNKVVPERDLEFLPNAGLMLPKVTFADAGLYTIDIEIDGCLQSKRYTQAAFLRVSGSSDSSYLKWCIIGVTFIVIVISSAVIIIKCRRRTSKKTTGENNYENDVIVNLTGPHIATSIPIQEKTGKNRTGDEVTSAGGDYEAMTENDTTYLNTNLTRHDSNDTQTTVSGGDVYAVVNKTSDRKTSDVGGDVYFVANKSREKTSNIITDIFAVTNGANEKGSDAGGDVYAVR